MTRIPCPVHLYVSLLCASLLPSLAPCQQGRPSGPGSSLTREQMWSAPTEEDWQRPVLITWQRSWEDALAVAAETGKAILICVNMDGEIASEHYAGIRYRQKEITDLYEPYVPVIASTYRHTPRDYDENGERIPCPRFGGVTCGEHISIEPFLFENFFDGTRVAPRHIMVELDGSETYDVYYAFDTASVFKAISDGIENRVDQPITRVRGDRTILERVASRESSDRTAVEAAYRAGDEATRRSLLEAAREHSDAAQVDLLRLAVFGFDTKLSKLARQALANTDATSAVGLLSEALRVPMDDSERENLIAALTRIGEKSAKARTLAVVHKGVGTRSKQVDLQGWSTAIAGGASYTAAPAWNDLESRLNQAEVAELAVKDAASQLELAESSLALAVDPATAQILAAGRNQSTYAQLMLEDAKRAAIQAEKLGADGWRVHATIALAAYYLGDDKEAYRRAELAVGDIPAGTEEWSAISTIALFAQARQLAIGKAVRDKADWPGQWLTDMNDAYSVLAKHPLGSDTHIASHYDFLKFLSASGPANRVLEEGLTRFPNSWVLHDRKRLQILGEKGASGLEPAYEAMLAKDGDSGNLEWFAGYTSIVAAEYHRRARRSDAAVAAYGRAIAHFDTAIEKKPDTRESADHYVAIALGGRARLSFEKGELETSLKDLLASFERRTEAAANLDGLNISPVDTAKQLLSGLKAAERNDLAAQLEAALGKLRPDQLALPAFERQAPAPRGGNRGGRRGRRRGR